MSTPPTARSAPKKDQIARALPELIAQGLGRNQVARMFNVAGGTVTAAARAAGLDFAAPAPIEAATALRQLLTARRYGMGEQLHDALTHVLGGIKASQDAVAVRQLAVAVGILVEKIVLLDAHVTTDIERVEAEHDRAETEQRNELLRSKVQVAALAQQLAEETGGTDAFLEQLQAEMRAEGIDPDSLGDEEEEDE